jgi:hypothetical protein
MSMGGKVMEKTAILILVAAVSAGCAASKGALQVSMEPLQLGQPVAQTEVLEKDHFQRDHAGSISEEDLRRVLRAPVFLEADSRLGVVPVATCYEPDPDLPLAVVPQELSRSMEDSGMFEVTTEVSTDWPADRGISGLRELAARYRSDYLLLYRHRFVDRSYTNDWGWLYVTVLGVLFAPAQTLESAGVLEATLFDVKTGTLLFTVFERVHAESDETVFHNDRKRRLMKEKLLAEAAGKLAAQVVEKSRRLAAARPIPPVSRTVTYNEKPAVEIGPTEQAAAE